MWVGRIKANVQKMTILIFGMFVLLIKSVSARAQSGHFSNVILDLEIIMSARNWYAWLDDTNISIYIFSYLIGNNFVPWMIKNDF